MSQDYPNEVPESIIRETEEFMSVSEEDVYRVMELLPLPVLITDADDRFLFVNQPAREFLNYGDEDLVGKKTPQIFYNRQPTLLAEAGKGPQANVERFETELLRRDGEIVWGEVFASLLPGNRNQIVICDITERKQAERDFILSEERLWQNQKYDALGKLAGGVAHELNNLLAIILLQTDILTLQLPPGSPYHHRVSEIKAVIDNAADIVQQMLAFGCRQVMYPSLIDLNQVVNLFSEKLPDLIKENIQVSINLNPDLGVCFIDYKQVENVLADLTRNAAAAMSEGGVLKIETTNIVLDEKSVKHAAQPTGSYIQLSVTDNGVGMNAEVKEQIFEPHFSAKPVNKGVGLDLATAYGIVKQLKGFIWVESERDRGTTFTIQFPKAEPPSTLAEY